MVITRSIQALVLITKSIIITITDLAILNNMTKGIHFNRAFSSGLEEVDNEGMVDEELEQVDTDDKLKEELEVINLEFNNCI